MLQKKLDNKEIDEKKHAQLRTSALGYKDKLNKELSARTGQPLERIQEDTDRDFFMSPSEAVEYGLIDTVLDKRPFHSV